MRDPHKSHLVTENAGPAKLQGRTAVHLDAPAAERQRSARALKASEIRYRRLFETAPYGIVVLDAETAVVVDVNPCLCKLIGYSQTEFLDHPLWSIAAFKNAATTKNQFRELLDQSHVRYRDLPLESKDGQIKRVELVSTLFLADNKRFVQCIVHDVTDRIKQEQADGDRAEQADLAATRSAQRSSDEATHDEVTGLVKRWYLEEALPRELHRTERAKAPLSVTMLALDGQTGDAMLREVGRVMREHLRKSDMACRYDDDEFVLVLPQSSPKATLERLEQIRAAIKNIELQHGDERLTGPAVSAGVATAGTDGATTRELVRAAHQALTAARKDGGDRVVLYQVQETQ